MTIESSYTVLNTNYVNVYICKGFFFLAYIFLVLPHSHTRCVTLLII